MVSVTVQIRDPIAGRQEKTEDLSTYLCEDCETALRGIIRRWGGNDQAELIASVVQDAVKKEIESSPLELAERVSHHYVSVVKAAKDLQRICEGSMDPLDQGRCEAVGHILKHIREKQESAFGNTLW